MSNEWNTIVFLQFCFTCFHYRRRFLLLFQWVYRWIYPTFANWYASQTLSLFFFFDLNFNENQIQFSSFNDLIKYRFESEKRGRCRLDRQNHHKIHFQSKTKSFVDETRKLSIYPIWIEFGHRRYDTMQNVRRSWGYKKRSIDSYLMASVAMNIVFHFASAVLSY